MRNPSLTDRMRAVYRRTGADLPGGDPRPTHGAEMEGWFWRFTDRDRGRVVIALCGINRHPQSDWATVAVAVHPGGWVQSAVVDPATASRYDLRVEAGSALSATSQHLVVSLGPIHLEAELRDRFEWPHLLGAGGLFSAIPFLGQYWHPHILGGRAWGQVTVAGQPMPLTGADIYAEKNWGAGFPDWWWWGQAQGFSDPRLAVAFGGGRLNAGWLAKDVTGCVVRRGRDVIRFAPPTARVDARIQGGAWQIAARKPGWRLMIDADGAGTTPTVLPVPLPAERRNVNRDFEHLAGRLQLQVWRKGSRWVNDESHLAGLEVGSTDPERAAALAHETQAPNPTEAER